MKNVIIHSTVVWLMLTAQPLWAACNPAIAITKPDAIYTDHGNGTVTDEQTGLMWQKCSLGQVYDAGTCSNAATTHNWQAALSVAQTANDGAGMLGYTDWRLPSVAELRSLVETACYSPAINSTLFPATSSYYWSASAFAGIISGYAWFVNFYDGDEPYSGKGTSRYVRLVRAGQ